MNKNDIIKAVCRDAKLKPYQADEAVSSFFEQVTNALARGENVNLIGFGAFKVKSRAAHPGKNPQTGEAIDIPQKNQVYFKPGKKLRLWVQ